MFAAIRFRHMALVGVLLCTVPSLARGQTSTCGLDHSNVCPPPTTSSGSGGAGGASGGNYGGTIGEIIGIPGDIIRAHKNAQAKKAKALNDQGIAAYNMKDWAAAEANFKEALKLNPTDRDLLRNLGMTQGLEGEDAYRKGDYTTALNYFQKALANDPADDPDKHILGENLAAAQGEIDAVQRKQEQRQQDKIAASKMQQSIQNLAQSLNAAPSSGGLDFNGGKPDNNSDKSSGLTFMTSNPAVADKSTRGRQQGRLWHGQRFVESHSGRFTGRRRRSYAFSG